MTVFYIGSKHIGVFEFLKYWKPINESYNGVFVNLDLHTNKIHYVIFSCQGMKTDASDFVCFRLLVFCFIYDTAVSW